MNKDLFYTIMKKKVQFAESLELKIVEIGTHELKEILSDIERLKRLEKALKWYAHRPNYIRSEEEIITGYPPEIINDKGYIARIALESEESE